MRIGRIVVASVAALAVVAGLLTYARVQSQRPVSLAPSGEFAVGRFTDLWIDRSRTDQFAPVGGTPRVLPVWVWYPAAPGASGPESAYAPGEWAGLHRFGWGATDFDRVRTGTRDGVEMARGPFPVVVLLPDLGLSAPQYAAVASGLAARGNVVVGPTPTYSSRISVINEQRVVASAAGSAADRREQLVSVWATDARFAAQRAAQQFGNHVDRGRIAYAGHGLGGSAAVEACRVDGRCAAAITLDGDAQSTGRPLLQLSPPGATHGYVLAGAGELSFTDYAAYRIAAPLRRTLPLGSLDGRRGLDITVDYAATFLAAAFGDATWVAPSYPEVHRATTTSG